MSAPKGTVNPRTHSVGIDQRLVTVRDIPAGQAVAICADRQGTEVRVPLYWQRAKGTLPAVGENWLVSQDNGRWTFSLFLGQAIAGTPAFEVTQGASGVGLQVQGSRTSGDPQLLVLDYLGDQLLGAGIVGVYTCGAPFICYDRFVVQAISLSPLGGGLTGTGAGIQNYAPMQSGLAGSPPASGPLYLNWDGTQDFWSGLNQDMFLPVTFSAGGTDSTVAVVLGAACVLTSPLVSGSAYSSLSVQGIPGVIPAGTVIVLRNGPNAQFAETSAQANYDGTILEVIPFTSSHDFPEWTSLGNAPTTWISVSSLSYPWYVPVITEKVPGAAPAGEVRTLRFTVPWKWWFQVSAVNAVIGNLQGLSI